MRSYTHPFTRPIERNTHYSTYHTDEKKLRKGEIQYLIAQGHTRFEIADALGISLSQLAGRMNRYGLRFKK